MVPISGPGSGIAPHSATWSMLGTLRNVQDELRATQNAKDQTPPGDGQSLIAHPVAEVQAGVAIPATTRHRGETDGTIIWL